MADQPRPMSQIQATNKPAPKTWDDYNKECLDAYPVKLSGTLGLDGFLRGVNAAFRLIEANFPPAEVCKAAPDLQADARRYAYIRDCLVQSHSHQMDGTATHHIRMIYGRAGTFDELVDGKIEEAVVEGYAPGGADESTPDGSQG